MEMITKNLLLLLAYV